MFGPSGSSVLPFWIKNASLAANRVSVREGFSMDINCMSLAVWLGEDRKCTTTVVGLDLVSGLSIIRRCSLNRYFKRRFVSPMYCKLQRLCTSQLKPPPFGSRGRIGDNRGIRSLLNNKLSPGGGSFDWFRLWVPSPRGAAVKRETGYQFFIWSFQDGGV